MKDITIVKYYKGTEWIQERRIHDKTKPIPKGYFKMSTSEAGKKLKEQFKNEDFLIYYKTYIKPNAKIKGMDKVKKLSLFGRIKRMFKI